MERSYSRSPQDNPDPQGGNYYEDNSIDDYPSEYFTDEETPEQDNDSDSWNDYSRTSSQYPSSDDEDDEDDDEDASWKSPPIEFYQDDAPSPPPFRRQSAVLERDIDDDEDDQSNEIPRRRSYSPNRSPSIMKKILAVVRILTFIIGIGLMLYSLYIRYTSRNLDNEEYKEMNAKSNRYLIIGLLIIFLAYMMKYAKRFVY